MEPQSYVAEEVNFSKYFSVLKRRWIPATATFATIVTLASISAMSRTPVYEAEGKVLIKSDKSAKLAGFNNQIGDVETLTQQSDPLSTEAEIVGSRPIIEKTIKELKLKNQQGKLAKFTKQIKTTFGIEDLEAAEQENKLLAVDSFRQKLTIKPSQGTDILEISYEDSDPKVATEVVNHLIKTYKAYDTASNRTEAGAAREFIDDQLPKVEKNVDKAEANLLNFKIQNKIANLSEETDTLIKAIEMLGSQINDTQVKLNDVNTRYAEMQKQLGIGLEEAAAVSSLSESVAVQRVLKEQQEVKVQLAAERNRFSDNSPQVISLKEREAELNNLLENQIRQTLGNQPNVNISKINILGLGTLKKQQIQELARLGAEKSGLSSQLITLKSKVIDHRTRLDRLSRLEKQQREFERRLKASQSTYQTLLDKLQEAQVTENQNVGKVRVVAEAAIPEQPSGPKRNLIFGAGLFLGTCLGVGVAFLLDLQDNSVKDSKEAEDIFGYLVQGIIPDFGKTGATALLPAYSSSNILTTIEPQNMLLAPVGEAYQILQANLKLFDKDQNNRIIAVTSSVPQEGKSHVSANLAIARAQVGKKVLLIDADMRRPKQHQLWNIENKMGLSNILRGELEWHQAVQGLMNGLDLITAGTIPSNPVAHIDSEQMRNLIATLNHKYDYIIFDTPPISGMADTRILGRMVDGVLMVVRPGVVDHRTAMAAKKLLLSTGQNVLGIVVNGVDMREQRYGYGDYLPEAYSSKK